ncbi:dTDP-glucose 4,6-dehydratase [Lysinibacillus agricola]|uniref:dTDP-glucose 4,6-dehydratase n=1 Tax=Lysinibacillus agricola TaxID=2590012 RepID=A0ABX7AU95_9BACI|nr:MULTISPECIES: dTDP-glucose 4,6-dehydratase [Lysinibacillus]KOS60728.1 spore coat protein [Lysinibacillus sp. FJAT-14222]QQP13256.1 dTDP-glucose 4,6-dehydratase [Lysinibacillus agricola]
MNLLVTGGAGFIGSNFIIYLLSKYPKYKIVNLDLLTYAGNSNNLKNVENHPNYEFVKGDICNRELVEFLFEKYNFNGVFHFAAESHVDNSIKNPGVFVKTNINGTYVLLDVARNHWMKAPNNFKKEFESARFHHISTDEVYGSLESEGYFTEDSPFAPNSPYSASKAASDMLVRSYYHTFGMNAVTTNCSNNFGPGQHSEKLIPTIIRKAIAFDPIPIYGSGQNIRDWLYVEEHCRAIDLVFHESNKGETYLIGGQNEKTNLEIVNDICGILDEKLSHKLEKRKMKSFKELITFVEDRAGHDFRYAVDTSKIQNELKFECKTNMKQVLNKLIDQYLMEGS